MSRIEEALRRASETASEPAQRHDAAVAEAEPRPIRGQNPVEMAGVDEYRSEWDVTPVPAPIACAPARTAPVSETRPAQAPVDGARHLERRVDEKRVDEKMVDEKPVDEKLVISETMEPVAVEQYRKLAATLHKIQSERGSRIIMVSSTMAGEGKTLTASNLALTLSESFGRRVLLIDADLRRPTVHDLFRIANVSGLNDCLNADEDRQPPLVQISPRLTVLPAGRPNPDPMSGLTSDRMRQIIEEAAAKFEWVVLDTPPIGLLPDANLLAEMVDLVVLVVGAGMTPFHLIERTIKAMDRSRIVGVVLNRAVQSHTKYHYYHYYAATPHRS